MILLKLHTVMGESTAHWWKSKLQINFTWTHTVRILCSWFQIQCKFWISDLGGHRESFGFSRAPPPPPSLWPLSLLGAGCRRVFMELETHLPGTHGPSTVLSVGEWEWPKNTLSGPTLPHPHRSAEKNIWHACFWLLSSAPPPPATPWLLSRSPSICLR